MLLNGLPPAGNYRGSMPLPAARSEIRVKEIPAGADTTASDYFSRGAGWPMSENTTEKQRLLIVDDSKVIRVTARKILQDHFETVEAVDGENAWQVLNGMGPFSLVVSDLTMPKLDGYGLLEKIRTAHNPSIRELPVIVITGDNDSKTTMQRARDAGATDFIGKPFDAVHLLARAQSHATAHVERKALTDKNIELEDQAVVDVQTGLANEAAFVKRGREQVSHAARHGKPLAVMQLEIDQYGELYRKYGETFANDMVQHVADVLASTTRQEDMAARTGAARFALLLTETKEDGVRTLTDRISAKIRDHGIHQDGEEVRFTVSIGTCTQEIKQGTQFTDLLAVAGRNLQQAIAGQGHGTLAGEQADSGTPPPADTASPDTAAEATPPPEVTEEASPDETGHPAEFLTLAADSPDTEDEVSVMDETSIAALLAGVVEQPATVNEAVSETVALQPDMQASAAEPVQHETAVEDGVETALQQETPAPEAAVVEQDSTEAAAATQQAADDALPEMFAEPVGVVSRKAAGKTARSRKDTTEQDKEGTVLETAPASPVDQGRLADSQAASNSVQPAAEGTQAPAGSPETAQQTAVHAATVGASGTRRKGLFGRLLALFKRSAR